MNEQIQYIGARYVIKIYENKTDPSKAEWDADTEYEPLTMVSFGYNSYLSKKLVPPAVGNPAANPEYWAQTGYYSGQIIDLQHQVDRVMDAINNEAVQRANGDNNLSSIIDNLRASMVQSISELESKDVALNSAITNETTARRNADTELNNLISSNSTAIEQEAVTRASADAALGARIDSIVAPSGEAPSAAEVEDARVGANGTTYASLGAAIRGQISDVTTDIKDELYSSRFLLTAPDYLTEEGKYIGTDGIEALSAYHVISDYILVLKGDTITYKLCGSNATVAVVYRYTMDKTPAGNIAVGAGATTAVTGTYTATADCYIRISNRIDFTDAKFNINNGGALLGIKKLIADDKEVVTEISSSDDLDNYTTVGKYYTGNYVVTNSLSNCPVVNAPITLLVEAFSAGYKSQTVISRNAPFIAYKRMYDGSTFTDWILVSVDEQGLFNARALLTADDILTDEGKYINYSDGTEVTNSNYVVSTMIPVCKGDIISYNLLGASPVALVTGYNYDGSLYGTLVQGTGASSTGNITCNGKYAYIKICNRKTYANRYFSINNGVALPQGVKTYINQRSKDYVPFYWENTIENAISRYYEKNALVGENGVSFMFITDTHTTSNHLKSPALINYLYKNTNIVNVVHGGDFVANSPSEALTYEKLFEPYVSLLPVVGNHDVDSAIGADDDTAYAYNFRRYENSFKDRDGFCYYFDIESQKTRFIMLDYRTTDSVTYLHNHARAGYKNVIFNHCYWWQYDSSTSTYAIDTVAQAIINEADSLKDDNYDIVAMIVGHIHQDKNAISLRGIPIISTNCDAASQSAVYGGKEMTGDTNTEQCFDLVNIDFTNRKLYFTRVGAGGSAADREISY